MFFEAVKATRCLKIDDVYSDPLVKTLDKKYFEKQNIKSILNAGIRLNGSVVGVICFEKTGESRHWTAEEGLFVGELSDIISQLLLARERKQAADKIKKGKERYETIARQIDLIIYDFDIISEEINLSGAIESVTGYSPKEMEAITFSKWHQMIHPEDLSDYLGKFERGKAASPVKYKIEYRIQKKNGEVILIEDEGAFITDNTKQTPRALGTLKDITERDRTQEIISQTEKMLSVGGLAAGMAHEINNPLAAILQNTQIIQARLLSDLSGNKRVANELDVTLDSIKEYCERRGLPESIDYIIDAGKRAAGIVDNLLSFSRHSETLFSPTDLSELIDRTVELAENDYELRKRIDFRKIRIIRDYQKGMPTVLCERSKIQQVILNLLQNSAHAIAERNEDEDTHQITIRLRQKEKMAVLEVEDDGVGMEENVRKRAFDPFFTTKEVGLGTGLGLSVSYFIITKNHNGLMEVESTPDTGTTFTITLPIEGK
jgi:PAS domain S-box-containing protein